MRLPAPRPSARMLLALVLGVLLVAAPATGVAAQDLDTREQYRRALLPHARANHPAPAPIPRGAAPTGIGQVWIESHPVVEGEGTERRVVGRQDLRVFVGEPLPYLSTVLPRIAEGQRNRYREVLNEQNRRLRGCADQWRLTSPGTVYFRTDGFHDRWLECVGGTAADPREPLLTLCLDDPGTRELDYRNCVVAAGHHYGTALPGGGEDLTQLRERQRQFRDELLRLADPDFQPLPGYGSFPALDPAGPAQESQELLSDELRPLGGLDPATLA